MFIPLTRGKIAVVDDDDRHLVAAFKWHASCVRLTWYAARWDERESLTKKRRRGYSGNLQAQLRSERGGKQ